jgi:tRNA threonylcarbamoyladenosine biosynthesis protein TsaE
LSEDVTVRIASAADMQALGERLGRALRAGDVLGLIGPLGAGKTTFVQGLARGAGVPPERHVASPTFALVNEHPGRIPLVHADLYRINDAAELDELGLQDCYDRAAVAIEWLDRFPEIAPADRLEIVLAMAPGGARDVTLRGLGPRGVELATTIAASSS